MSEKMQPVKVRASLHQSLKLEAITSGKTLEKLIDEILMEYVNKKLEKNNE